MSAFDNFLFVSSGDPEEDARIAAQIVLQRAREAEGMCPNGDAALTRIADDTVMCPGCGFQGVGAYRLPGEVKSSRDGENGGGR